MKNVLLQAAMKLNKGRTKQKWWRIGVRITAILVVFCTTYALILPAITMNRTPVCGLEEHLHTELCFTRETVTRYGCGTEENVGHTHDAICYALGELICTLPEIEAHIHTEECMETTEKSVLTCTLPEHGHDDTCYRVESIGTQTYLCGLGVHSHIESCFDAEGALTCSIPQHTHEAACIVAALDLTADVETRQQWESSLNTVVYTGVWREDLLAVANSQIGYKESTRNVVQEGGELKGYTRYGGWYGQPYSKWDTLFVAFCLEYAEITREDVPFDPDISKWIDALTEKGLYAAAAGCTPKAGDLIFTDTDSDGSADRVAIVAPGTAQAIAGDTENGTVSLETIGEGVVGYGILPENPLTPEQWADTKKVQAMLAALPAAEDVKNSLQALNDQGDKAGYEALRQELLARVDAIRTLYETFNDLQRAKIAGMEKLDPLQEACGGSWQPFPTLLDDSAVVAGLREDGVAIHAEGLRAQLENTIGNGDTVEYTVTVDVEAYYTDVKYGEAQVRLEILLPLDSTKAEISPMDWLENRQDTVETRVIGGVEILCQVVTGYKRLTADDIKGIVVPGSFTEVIPVSVQNMAHGEQLVLIVSAAMEHGTWEGLCQTHQIEEKLTIATNPLVLYMPQPEELQQLTYEYFLQTLEALDEDTEELENLRQAMADAYAAGQLSEEQYSQLNLKALALWGVDPNAVAEPSVGDGWIWMDFGQNSLEIPSEVQAERIPVAAAMPMTVYRELGLDSNSQIPENGWGGENSADDVIWISKTIEGTEQENVFDITLQVITKEKINEVYKEPDMAVVIVMDISNTMTSVFSGETKVTRYDAAMTAAQHFLESFAEKTDGISRVGYVAFNTHAHQVFAMQECSTAAQARTLSNTMRNKTGSIMTNAAKQTASGKYSDSHDRFTNIQGGLKMAQDMLSGVHNQHKYIILLSDGFPTTYLKSGYTGYDPYTPTGTNGRDGVFYDGVMGVHCDFGASYSDTAAIKAREQAVALKKAGINIFSIGVDVAGQTIKSYHDSSVNNMKTFSVVERRKNASYYNTNGYEIGTLHTEITKPKPSAAETAAMAQDFKDWLKGSATTGIGSGYYYDSSDLSGLESAYSSIFQRILEMNAESAHLDWVATDPMPDMGVHELETIEFIGFWDINNVLQQVLVGESKDNALYLNSATFDTDESTIHWDLKHSGYQMVSYGNNKNYMCAMKYRVRLKNENTGFVERQIYDTNDTTFLNYRVIEVVNNVTVVSDSRYIEFPIPKAFGYLAELNFKKITSSEAALPGAEFTLTHDTESCGYCRGDGAGHVQLPEYRATSGGDGMVTFTNIPSGHHYLLTETKTPDGYIPTDNTYRVVVAYDNLTVTVLDADGNPLEWTSTIENDTYYALPKTGSVGVHPFAVGGLLMIAVAMFCISFIDTRKNRKRE